MENPINDVHCHVAFMTQEKTGEREKGEFGLCFPEIEHFLPSPSSCLSLDMDAA
jgi:hypothetical protein